MPYCIECGSQIPEKAKFCPGCGSKTFQTEPNQPAQDKVNEPSVATSSESSASKVSVTPKTNNTDSAFTLLDNGERFRDYTIVRLLNKDQDGIKYIATKDGSDQLLLLKVFHNFYYDRAEKVFTIQMSLNHLNKINESFIPKVIEVNQGSSPRFMAAEYIEGESLQEIKHNDPQRLTEEYVREISRQLIDAAATINKHGLSINNLNLLGVMVRENGKISILLSGITFDGGIDEREDVFTIGVIIAQLMSKSGFYSSIYSDARLRLNKFHYVNGCTISFNKFIADCVHRNASQRFSNVQKMQKALSKLPPYNPDELFVDKEESGITFEVAARSVDKPKGRIDFLFWTLVALILAGLVLVMTTNIYSYIFGAPDTEFQFTAFSTRADTTSVAPLTPPPPPISRDINVPSTGYGDFRTQGSTTDTQVGDDGLQIDPRRNLQVQVQTRPGVQENIKAKGIPEHMVFIDSNTFGFGRLKDNLHHNVSISGFYISKYEVTQGEWNRFMRAANVTARGDDLPVENVSWFDAVLYANGLSESEGLTPCYRIRGLGNARVVTCDFRANGYRLPTEAEWEIAAKGGQLFNYSGSEDPDEVAWYKDNSSGRTRKPGQLAPNGFGLYDMTGNVAEWCWDWFDGNYTRTLTTFVNPTGPDTGTHKSIRGGSILNGDGRNLNIIFRDKGEPGRGYPFVGFRLVRIN